MSDTACERLFRYRSLDGKFAWSNVEDILLHSKMWWANPSDLNDPFDVNPSFALPANTIRFKKYVAGAAKRVMAGAPRRRRRQQIREVLARKPEQYIEDLRCGFVKFTKSCAVLCFSLRQDCPLMWTHYSDSHRGVVFEFVELYDDGDIFLAHDVHYSDKRPSVRPETLEQDTLFRDAILTKSNVWSYEREKRMISTEKGEGYRAFPRKALISMTFGCRISDKDKEKLIEINQRRKQPIAMFQAELHSSDYSLDINTFSSV